MENNKNLEQVLQHLPQTTITYTQKPCMSMTVPYVLTVKDYKKLYLNDTELEDLQPEEQLILLHSNNPDPTYNPSTTLAGIFKAREIIKRSQNKDEALAKCNQTLVDINRAHFKKRGSITRIASEKNMRANLLEYYLKANETMQEYERQQASIFAPIINLKNRITAKLKRSSYQIPPFTQDELERGNEEWEKFRKEQNADGTVSDKELLRRYRFPSEHKSKQPFEFLYDDPELSAISEEYATTTIALQILDGSALRKALGALNRNPYQYIKKVKALNSSQQKEI